MKATQPKWPDNVPAWEHHEVRRHYDCEDQTLTSRFLESSIPLSEAIERRQHGEPLEYILKHFHHGSLNFEIDDRALIPRAETETLVELFLDRIESLPEGYIVDCGTGSGFISALVSFSCDRRVVAIDRYRDPLKLARKNRKQPEVNYLLLQGDRLQSLGKPAAGVVANLPYLRPDSPKLKKSVRKFEPQEALFPDQPIEKFYREFIKQTYHVLRAGGELWLELEPEIINYLENDIDFKNPWNRFESKTDNRGIRRFFYLRKSCD